MARGIRRYCRGSAPWMVAATTVLIAATPASAGGLRNVTAAPGSSLMSSSTTKTLNVSCNTGGSAVGGAAFVSPGLGNLGLWGVGSLGAGAAETDSESSAWRLSARRLCVTYTAQAPPIGGAASYVKAVSIARGRSASNSLPVKSVLVRCPAGKTAISGGGRVSPPNIDVAFTAMQRANANTAWRISAHEVDATSASWNLYASVVCANVSTETATSDYASGYSSPGQASSVSASALQSVAPTCSPGWFVVGGGARVEGATPSQAPPSDVVITSSDPTGSTAASTAWIAIARKTDPNGQPWRLVGQVICSLNGSRA